MKSREPWGDTALGLMESDVYLHNLNCSAGGIAPTSITQTLMLHFHHFPSHRLEIHLICVHLDVNRRSVSHDFIQQIIRFL